MVSEIKGPGPTSVTPLDPAPRKVGDTAAPAPGRASGGTDVVTLTDLAARLQRLVASVDQLPVVDQAKVAELREAIESGSYAIDERAIAEKLSAFEALIGSGEKA